MHVQSSPELKAVKSAAISRQAQKEDTSLSKAGVAALVFVFAFLLLVIARVAYAA